MTLKDFRITRALTAYPLQRFLITCFVVVAACDDANNATTVAGKDAGAHATAPCGRQLKELFAACPTTGTCTMSTPDARGPVVHCYADGSKDMMTMTSTGADISVFKPNGQPCYRIRSERMDGEYDILNPKGIVITSAKKLRDGTLLARCGGVTFDLNEYRSPAALKALVGCSQGPCSLTEDPRPQ